ncbi:MAG: spherulation-specific family 4 protein [Betaproteobacteria bacterium]|jgi:hypothetical protein|uniref:spherulation-specific family 4 protein n=1 Tax=Thiomonas sp. TaxID=2047785 RepID=UPI00239EEBC8|nr:spherulation-specific family 4 protein [Thiomonas sp.]MDE2128340.1 spherulation-specific family 4 protein [Betaproteobacteria bacterium]
MAHSRFALLMTAVTAITAIWLTSCGGGGSSPPATAQRKAMGILVPLYAYPQVSSGSGASQVAQASPAWTAVASGAALVPTIAIINPASGPVACTNPASATLLDFQRGIAQLHASGVTVLGYVHTSYGQRPQSAVLQDVLTYAQCYGLDGIFFDEISASASYASYDAAIANAARGGIRAPSGAPALVVFNPGTYPEPQVAQSADITVMHESADLNVPAAPAALAAYPAGRWAYLAFGISQPVQGALSKLFADGTGDVYITDQGAGGTDPWTQIATDYVGLVQTIQALNRTAAP